MKIELIYDQDCPNVDDTRQRIKQALKQLKLPEQWIEWDRSSTDSPSYAHSYGSPTVLVNSRDIAGVEPSGDNCCRVYVDDEHLGFNKTPGVSMIVKAIENATEHS